MAEVLGAYRAGKSARLGPGEVSAQVQQQRPYRATLADFQSYCQVRLLGGCKRAATHNNNCELCASRQCPELLLARRPPPGAQGQGRRGCRHSTVLLY